MSWKSMKKILMPSPEHLTKDTRHSEMFLLDLANDGKIIQVLPGEKNSVFPERWETCLICDRKTLRMNHPKCSQQF